MKQPKDSIKNTIRESRFPPSLFAIYLGVLLIMSGVHTGLLVLMDKLGWNDFIQSAVPILYWSAVAIGLTLFTRRKVRKTYDIPMRQLAEATDKVAHGDFSVFVPPIHTLEKKDYLDLMIMDFNKMVEELGSIETLKTDFFSNVSHEIKTPFSIIQSHAELLHSDHLPENQRKEYTEMILKATHRLSNLITNMLKLSKLEKQAITPMPEPYDVCRQLCECALQFEDVWEKKGIEFIADIEERAIISADGELMALVWNNLLSNAVKFTEPGGTVILRQTSNEKEILVQIKDNGCGMSEKTLEHIFDKFYQGDTSHATEGNGLGLAIALRVLQLLSFNIFAESAVGKGSTFTVQIPIQEEVV